MHASTGEGHGHAGNLQDAIGRALQAAMHGVSHFGVFLLVSGISYNEETHEFSVDVAPLFLDNDSPLPADEPTLEYAMKLLEDFRLAEENIKRENARKLHHEYLQALVIRHIIDLINEINRPQIETTGPEIIEPKVEVYFSEQAHDTIDEWQEQLTEENKPALKLYHVALPEPRRDLAA